MVVGGARTAAGVLMLHESTDVAVGEGPLLERLSALLEIILPGVDCRRWKDQ